MIMFGHKQHTFAAAGLGSMGFHALYSLCTISSAAMGFIDQKVAEEVLLYAAGFFMESPEETDGLMCVFCFESHQKMGRGV